MSSRVSVGRKDCDKVTKICYPRQSIKPDYSVILDSVEDIPFPYRENGIYFVRDGDYISVYAVLTGGTLTKQTTFTNLYTVENIAELKTIEGVDSAYVIVRGYYVDGDGGGGDFFWNDSSTETDNAGTIIQTTGITIGRWIRTNYDILNVKYFGAKGDGSSNDSTSIQTAIATNIQGKLLFPPGTYKCNITVNNNTRIVGSGREKTIFKAQSNVSPIITFNDTGSVTFLDTYFIGGEHFSVKGDTTASVGIKIGTGPSPNTVTYGSLSNVHVFQCIENLYIKDTVGFTLDNVWSYFATNNGLLIDTNDIVTVLNVNQCSFTQNTTGVRLQGGSLITFNSSIIESNKDIGLFFSKVTASGARQAVFNTCWFEGNGHTPSTGATSSIFIDINSGLLTNTAQYLTFNNCIMSNSIGIKNVFLNRGDSIFFNYCTFDALTSAYLYAETGNGNAFAKLVQCGTLSEKANPTTYSSFPALFSSGGGTKEQGFIYEYSYNGFVYTNQKTASFYWYLVNSATGLAATGNGAEYNTSTLSGSSSSFFLYNHQGSVSSGIFTAPRAGLYEFDICFPISNFSSAMNDAEVAFIKDHLGTPVRYVANKKRINSYTSTFIETYIGSISLFLNSGETIVGSIKISGGAGNTAEIYRNGTGTGYFSFKGRLIK